MARASVEEKLDSYEREKQLRALYEPDWQQIGKYVLPKRADVLFKQSPGSNRMSNVFDSTAIHSNVILAASMQGSLVSGAVRWFDLSVRDIDLKDQPELGAELDKCANAMYSAINQSNHSSESPELCLDLGAFGIGGIFVEEEDPKPGQIFTGIRHKALHPGEFCIAENAEGYVDTVYREFTLPADVALRTYGAALSEKTMKMAMNPRQQGEPITFVHVVCPNDYQRARTKRWPIYSTVIEVDQKHRVSESGYYEMPFMTPRWSKNSGEIYGTGPGLIAMPDVLTLNKAVELKLRAWALMVNPPLQVRDKGVIGTVKLNPFGITHVRDMEAIKPLWAIGGRLDVANLEEDKLRAQIRRVFYSDQLQLQDGPQMTAYEVQVRYELMQRVLGPTLGRLEVEWLNAYIERVFWILLRRSPKDSPFNRVAAILKQMGKKLDIEYSGPLARAQRLQESVATQRFFQVIVPLKELFPDITDAVNPDAVADLHAFAAGVPKAVLTTPEQRQKIRDERRAAAEKEQLMANAERAIGVAATGATAAKALREAGAADIVPPTAGELSVGATPRL